MNSVRQEQPIQVAPPVVGGSRLEQLPVELIQSIFDSLYRPQSCDQQDLIRPLSKQLLPYSTIALYRRIQIGSGKDLAILCTTVSRKPPLAHHIQELEFYSSGHLHKDPDEPDNDEVWTVLERYRVLLSDYSDFISDSFMVDDLLAAATQLRILVVNGWDSVAKSVLSERFGKEGGRVLESIKLANSFQSIEGSIITAWGHLRHLPRLSTIEYFNSYNMFEEDNDNPPNLGGFEQLKSLKCALSDFSSPHAISFVQLFPPVGLTSVILGGESTFIRPNYGVLDHLPDSITKLDLTCSMDGVWGDSVQHPLSLNRFHKLQELSFSNYHIFDEKLVDQLVTLSNDSLLHLRISHNCRITFQLLQRLLSGLQKHSKFTEIYLGSLMSVGTIGLSYKNGAKPVLENDILVPGAGWKRPVWSWITLLQARELEMVCIRKGIMLTGTIKEAFKVEKAFEEEEKWLENTMKFMRIGRID